MPETRYAQSGEVNIAYQVIGDGPIDLVYMPGFISHVELSWGLPGRGDFLRALGEFTRVIQLDKRGTGMSDRVRDLPTIETLVQDVCAVMDAAESERAALFGVDAGGPASILFAARHPDRAAALILFGTSARVLRSDDHPYGPTEEQYCGQIERDMERWGSLEHGVDVMSLYAPSLASAGDDVARDWASYFRESATPETFGAFQRINMEIDVCGLLDVLDAPTLVAHRTDDRVVELAAGRFLADRIPGAQFVELPGADHTPFTADRQPLVDAVREFLAAVPVRA
ncbi:MAG TPA: alpha/beta hydrolase [Gaiellaceae bacterium]|jgi:pimeloyl-ACP methyl ester carboxylesterase